MIPKPIRAGVERFLLRLTLAVVVRRATPGRGHVVIAPPGRGNVGDQALVQAAVDNIDGPVVVVVRTLGDFEPLLGDTDRVRLLALPNLLYGRMVDSAKDGIALAAEVRDAAHFSVIGADIMDGAYSEPASVRRMGWASAVARHRDSRVLGFSWNSHPTPLALDALRRAHPALRLLAREPRTAERLRPHTRAQVVDTADTVFRLVRREEPSAVLDWVEAQQRPVMVANVNALIDRKVGQVGPFVTICEDLIRQGWSVLLMPHGPRISPSDVEVAHAAAALLPGEHVRVADDVLSPNQIQTVAGAADLVVTGRMHLAVMAMSVGTPTLTISYQGKVQGLYELLGLGEYWLDLDGDFAGRLRERTAAIVGELAAVRQALGERMPAVHALAARNFDGVSSRVAALQPTAS